MDKNNLELLQHKLKDSFCKESPLKPQYEINNYVCCEKKDSDCCEVVKFHCCDEKGKDTCNVCDCCVKPLKYILEQFSPNDLIEVYIDNGYYYGWGGSSYFVSVNDGILTINDNWYGTVKIPLCNIVSIGPIPEDIELLECTHKCEKDFCSCCEKPIRKTLEAFLGLYVYLGLPYSSYADGVVKEVSCGIAILDVYGTRYAFSTCKIAVVELYNPMPSSASDAPKEKKIHEMPPRNIFSKKQQ